MNNRDKFVAKRSMDKLEERFNNLIRDHPVMKLSGVTIKLLLERAKDEAMIILEHELIGGS